ncbi:AraC family transcriptional regulator [Mesorhizobium sp. J8]|uniref:AraC family transcriptional regulator n=1 Tax=Mesorhizobium sp. J8 TaxID=2777475 RepID=UPI001915BF07|nr:helix-turn-helix transcriptional regulator [Mesorhizobium sp. J8]
MKEIHGFGALASCRTLQTSAGRNWEKVYLSMQIEDPNDATFPASPHLLIRLTRSGSAKIVANIEGQEHRANTRPGHLDIVTPGQPIRLKWDRCVHTTHLYLHATLLAEIAADLGETRPIEIFSRLALTDPLLEQLVTEISEALEFDAEGPYSYVEHLARVAAGRILRRYSNLHPANTAEYPTGEFDSKQLASVHEVIEARMSQKLSLADLAERSGFSPDHFARLFKKATGKTPYQYLMDSRIQRARYLLANTSMPIMQIAAECGFADQVHFNKAFSKIVGRPPGAFRRLPAQ